MDIELVKSYFIEEVSKEIVDKNDISGTRLLIDYSFLTMICGNDFVSSVPFLKMKEGGLELLIRIYNKVLKDSGSDSDSGIKNLILFTDNPGISCIPDSTGKLTKKAKISFQIFKKIISILKDSEQAYYQKLQKKRDAVRKGLYPKTFEETDLVKLKYLKFQHLEFYNPEHPLFEKYNKVFNAINYYDKDWVSVYNKFFFNINSTSNKNESIDINSKNDINDVVKDYISSLKFCLDYYLANGSDDFDNLYCYKYRTAPTFSDIYNYLDTINESDFYVEDEDKDKDKDKNEDKLKTTDTIFPFEQLLMITPNDYKFILPKVLHAGIDTESNIKLDIMHGIKYIYSEPILEMPNYKKIKEFVDAHKHLFTESEKLRNQRL